MYSVSHIPCPRPAVDMSNAPADRESILHNNITLFGKAYYEKIYTYVMYARIRDRSVTPVFMFHYCFLSTFKVF